MKRISLLIALLSLISIGLNAQDLISRKNPKAEIECKIIEIGEELVYYTAKVGGEERRFSIDKNNIIYIRFANGEIMEMEHSMYGAGNYEDNSKNAIKINFLSPLAGFSEFDYERSIKPGMSWTSGITLYGLGFDNHFDMIGLNLRGGFRFYRSPDYYFRSLKYSHILKGSYVMPVMQFGVNNLRMYKYMEEPVRENIANLNLLLNFGKQWVFSDVFLIDLYVGLGYSFTNFNKKFFDNSGDLHITYEYSSPFYSIGSNFIMSSGISIGLLFKDKKQRQTP